MCFRLNNAIFWTDSAEKRNFLDWFGWTKWFSGRIRLKNVIFWTDSAEKHDFLDGFVWKTWFLTSSGGLVGCIWIEIGWGIVFSALEGLVPSISGRFSIFRIFRNFRKIGFPIFPIIPRGSPYYPTWISLLSHVECWKWAQNSDGLDLFTLPDVQHVRTIVTKLVHKYPFSTKLCMHLDMI